MQSVRVDVGERQGRLECTGTSAAVYSTRGHDPLSTRPVVIPRNQAAEVHRINAHWAQTRPTPRNARHFTLPTWVFSNGSER